MAYTTPHSAFEYLCAAALFVGHDYVLRCQRRPDKYKQSLLKSTREIDLCGRMASFFGPAAHLAAQGTSDIDIQVDGPTIRAEVKYFKPPAVAWTGSPGASADWDWLLKGSNTGDEFRKRAWVVFWPSTSLYRFTQCLSITRSNGATFSPGDYQPFSPYVAPELPPHGTNERLAFRAALKRVTVLQVVGGKKVRVDLVGSQTHPLWCAVYTRLTPADAAALETGDA